MMIDNDAHDMATKTTTSTMVQAIAARQPVCASREQRKSLGLGTRMSKSLALTANPPWRAEVSQA
jgi:hypothetical protein